MLRPEPITEPAEVVRCSECKHYQLVPFADGTDRPICTGALVRAEPRPDTFCSWEARHDG